MAKEGVAANGWLPTNDTRQALDQMREARKGSEWRILAEFAELLALENITRDLPALRRNAVTIAAMFTARGAAMEVVERDGAAPVVIGRLGADPERPTLGVYAHYDGQPVGEGWWTPAFNPVLRAKDGTLVPFPQAGEPIDEDWRLYARSVADDKAPLMALAAALDAVAATGLSLAVNLTFCFEGEEESGSEHLRPYLESLRDQLSAGAWLICDGPVHQTGAPQVVLGVRGYCAFELTVYGADHELHSGHYANWAPNPALALARLLASFKDGSGTVTIDGFYDRTRQPTVAECAALAELPHVEPGLLGGLGLAAAEVTGSRLVDRLMLPSLNIRGLQAAAVGMGARNVIPNRATASVDIRLAVGDEPDQMLRLVREHIERLGFQVLDREPTPVERRRHRHLARFEPEVGYPAARAPIESAIVTHLVGIASLAAGRAALTMPTLGGSVPLHLISDILAAPAIVLPIANADNNQHAANENLRLGQLWYGIDLWSLHDLFHLLVPAGGGDDLDPSSS
jgi:acetylornithine deacetylase/succinyl-diaminopimelate desuccinylase-like protein